MTTSAKSAKSTPAGNSADSADTCERHQGAWVTTSDLYEAYQGWCHGNGIKVPMTKNALGRKLSSRDGITSGNNASRGGRHWTGLGLRQTL